MTRLRCVCGAVVEGVGEELLTAVEQHLAEAHPEIRSAHVVLRDESGKVGPAPAAAAAAEAPPGTVGRQA